MTQDEQKLAFSRCTKFLGGHYPRTISQRMQEIAESQYAKLPSDNYGSGGFVSELEQELASLFGKEAAVFMPSGTMAQPIALRIWADRTGNRTVGFHPRCHLHCHEHMAYVELHHLEGVLLGEPNRLFTLDDLRSIQSHIGTLLIELPQRDLGGEIPLTEDLLDIIQYAKDRRMKLHLDGARLWECQPYFGCSYQEIVRDFDSLYVSFYKILGGLPGAALIGPADFVAEARIWMRRHGGNLHNMFSSAISAKIGMDRHLHRIPEYVSKAQEIAAAVAGLDGITVVPAKPQTNMFHLHFDVAADQIMESSAIMATEHGISLIRHVTDNGKVRTAEITIGEAALDLTGLEIRNNLESLEVKSRV